MVETQGLSEGTPPRAIAGQSVPVVVRLLDGFEVSHDGESVPLPLASQRLVAFLALHGKPLLRLYVAGSLWLDTDERRSCANLRSTLCRLRRLRAPVVEASVTHVGLARTVVVDVHELVRSARNVLMGAPGPAGPRFDERSLDGELLPDWYDDWLEPERERLHQLRLHAVETEAARALCDGRPADALDLALGALRSAPLRESLHALAIRGHLAQGNRHDAIRHHRGYIQRMAELGLPPSAEIAGLIQCTTMLLES
jgi:DNA-binding SARP family transcriptional activator